ncbi:MAG: RIP metalloprotease RseP [Desulfobacterales bacterium]|nr:RIP metalloprotease RseP [Desulfobacterales bacterium]
MTTNIFAFAIVLGVLIFFHELGHFLVARLFGVGVERFSLGFGPRLFGKKVGITDYRISAIPLGGYVKMVGEEPNAKIDPKDIPISFTHKNVFKRILIVAAGPLFNILLAVIIFYILLQISGAMILKPTIGKVELDSPAFKGGLQKGDLVLAINESPVDSWDDMAALISESKGSALAIAVEREAEVKQLTVTPQIKTTKNIFGEDVQRFVIGIQSAGDVLEKKLTPLQAVTESFVQTYTIAKLTVLSVVKLIQGSISTKTLGGPIMIAQMAGQQAKEGTANLAFFIALISINLAIINFLPIPVLDGGHLLFFSIEAIIRRPVNLRIREIAQQVGVFILFLLMVYVIYNDIARIFFS